jgi:hypothetical protein
MPTEIKTGVGRILWGHPIKSKVKTDLNTKQPKLNKEGQPVQQWSFGVAFPKAEFQRDIWPGMSSEAATGYPRGVPPKFAWKYVDGDGPDHNGVPFGTREGYAGCYVLSISSEAFAPPVYKFQNGAYVQLGMDEIKCGDYVALALKLAVNVPQQSTHTPGLYVNPVAVEFIGYGTEIQNGPDPMALFGGQQRQLPQGASATPIAPSHGVGMPGTGGPAPQQPMQQPGQMPGQMQPGGPQPGYPQPGPGYTPQADPRFTGGGMPNGAPNPGGYQPPNPGPQGQYYPPQQNGGMPGPGQHVQPAHDFVHNAGQQQPGGQPMHQGMPQPNPGQQYATPSGAQYQPNPQQQYAPPPNGGYQPQPGQMPGMPPNR